MTPPLTDPGPGSVRQRVLHVYVISGPDNYQRFTSFEPDSIGGPLIELIGKI